MQGVGANGTLCVRELKYSSMLTKDKRIQTPQGLSIGTMATHEIALLVAVAEGALQLVLLLCQDSFGGATWNCVLPRPVTACRTKLAKMNR